MTTMYHISVMNTHILNAAIVMLTGIPDDLIRNMKYLSVNSTSSLGSVFVTKAWHFARF